MSDEYKRGTAKKITIEFEYPDGSTKKLEVENPETVESLIFTSHRLSDSDKGQFDVSADDWTKNPGVMVHQGITGESRGVPFCTHNGCKM